MPPMQHNVAQRLRADQVFDNLLLVLEASEPAARRPDWPAGAARFARGPRRQFSTAFGYDPSARRDEMQSSIPQALNAHELADSRPAPPRHRQHDARPQARRDQRRLGPRAGALPPRPRPRSQPKRTRHLPPIPSNKSSNRTEAFEDILWSLLNTAEFLHSHMRMGPAVLAAVDLAHLLRRPPASPTRTAHVQPPHPILRLHPPRLISAVATSSRSSPPLLRPTGALSWQDHLIGQRADAAQSRQGLHPALDARRPQPIRNLRPQAGPRQRRRNQSDQDDDPRRSRFPKTCRKSPKRRTTSASSAR